jgi:hypothetical protein
MIMTLSDRLEAAIVGNDHEMTAADEHPQQIRLSVTTASPLDKEPAAGRFVSSAGKYPVDDDHGILAEYQPDHQ